MRPSKHPVRSAAEWEESFDLFHASDLSQRAFCDQHELSHDAFRNRYRTSPKFAGKRRASPGKSQPATSATGRSSSAFRSVTRAPRALVAASEGRSPATVVVRVREAVSIECFAGADPVAVAALVAELCR